MFIFIYVVTILVILTYQNNFSDNLTRLESHLGTKTPYRLIANKTSVELNYQNCKPLKIWMLIRHGTRNPTAKFIKAMRNRLPHIRDAIVEANQNLDQLNLNLFHNWQLLVNISDEKKLTHEGEDEMIELAERMQMRFPQMFPFNYSNTTYKFQFTDSQRTRSSMKYFAVGLFGKPTANQVWYPEPYKKDPILRFYKLCSKWENHIKNGLAAYMELRKFQTAPIMERTVAAINSRLKLNNILTKEDIHLMYLTCAYETAWNKRLKSPWCTPFTIETIQVMEYAEDLKYYWIDGYGYELTYKQACPTIRDMINFFNLNNNNTKAAIYFTHSGTLLKILSHLGLYRDSTPLMHSNFNPNRQWKVSKIGAFGTNIAVALYQCRTEKRMLLLHQENIIRFPNCPDDDLCSVEKILTYYNQSIHDCNFDKMCEN